MPPTPRPQIVFGGMPAGLGIGVIEPVLMVEIGDRGRDVAARGPADPIQGTHTPDNLGPGRYRNSIPVSGFSIFSVMMSKRA